MDRFSDLRVLRWADRISAAIKGHPDLTNRLTHRKGPVRVNLDLTNLCSHGCPWCEPLQYREQTIHDQRHTLAKFAALEVIDDLADMDCKTVVFSGGGEPTLHPDFGVILNYAIEKGLRTSIVTHGGLMHKWLPQLINAHHIRISLDASNEAEHMAMHGTKAGEFEKVMENIRLLCRERQPGGVEVGIAFIVADCNSYGASFQRVLEFCSDIGVDFIQFRPLSEQTPNRFTGDWGLLAQQIARMAPAVTSVKTYITGKRHKDVFTQREFAKCYSARTVGVIGANGDVVACCDERSVIFGNVYQEKFRNIWMSAKHLQKSAEIAPKLCGTCLQCGYNRGVQDYVVENLALPELV